MSRIFGSDSFTVLYEFDFFGNRIGDPIGNFLVTYDATTPVLSDFQPVADVLRQAQQPDSRVIDRPRVGERPNL